MKNSADLGGCYPPRLSASVDNTLLDLQNSSYPTQPHSIIAKYCICRKNISTIDLANLARQLNEDSLSKIYLKKTFSAYITRTVNFSKTNK